MFNAGQPNRKVKMVWVNEDPKNFKKPWIKTRRDVKYDILRNVSRKTNLGLSMEDEFFKRLREIKKKRVEHEFEKEEDDFLAMDKTVGLSFSLLFVFF